MKIDLNNLSSFLKSTEICTVITLEELDRNLAPNEDSSDGLLDQELAANGNEEWEDYLQLEDEDIASPSSSTSNDHRDECPSH